MGYFPFFIDIREKKCLIVGGGKVALRKAEKLFAFEPQITVVAPEICGELAEMNIKIERRVFRASDLLGVFMCIAATNDRAVNHRIYRLCTKRGILVNCVDDPKYCGFIFPSLVSKGDISIGISTSGSAPAFAKYLRGKTEEMLDERTMSAAAFLKNVRGKSVSGLESEADKARAAEAIIGLFLSSETEPDENIINELIERIKQGHG